MFSSLPADLPGARARAARGTWVSLGLLVLCLLLDAFVSRGPVVLTLLALLPLIMFLPGLYQKNHRSLAYLCFVCLLYFTVIVTNVFAGDRTFFDFAALAAVSSLFIWAMLYSRWLRAETSEN
ncbi:MAG TPA: hypothetical protein DCZ13_04510 [Porticoccaceae bacterium]|nr:hypothetical protein [Porticoccaceae bacterium]